MLIKWFKSFKSSFTRLCIGSLYLESCILCPPLYRIYHKLIEEHLVCGSSDRRRVRMARERCLQILDYTLPLCRQFIYIVCWLLVEELCLCCQKGLSLSKTVVFNLCVQTLGVVEELFHRGHLTPPLNTDIYIIICNSNPIIVMK